MKKNFLIVVANYYDKIALDLLGGAKLRLKTYRVPAVSTFTVPGIFEIPVVIARNIKKFDAFIALGCVIKGQTPHFDYICSAVTNGIMDISITHKKPIGYGILTCNNMKQAIKRADPNTLDKGGYAASAIISILNHIK